MVFLTKLQCGSTQSLCNVSCRRESTSLPSSDLILSLVSF